MNIRALIADDEPLARERLRTLLEGHPNIEIIGEAEHGRQALELIRQEKPELLFLDIQMPEMDGFELLEELGEARPPVVIFVTAYDKFALRAFEVHALDYLLKPFDRERFEKALERAVERLGKAPGRELDQRLTALLSDLKGESRSPERIAIKTDGRVLILKTSDVDWIEAADNYVLIHIGRESHLHRETLTALENKLTHRFLRINRSILVNTDKIKELQPMFHGEYTVVLHNGTRLTLSRTHRDKLDRLLNR